MTYTYHHRIGPRVTENHIGTLSVCAVIALVLWASTGGGIAAFITGWSAIGVLLALKTR